MTPAERPDVGMSLITTKEYRTLLKEADRSLLLDAALRALVEEWDKHPGIAMGPAIEEARAALAATDVRGAVEALRVAINGFRWLGNNLHNSGTEEFREFYRAALDDAKEAMGDDWEPIALAAKGVEG